MSNPLNNLDADSIYPILGKSIWTIAFARLSPITCRTFLQPWSCMTLCANMECTSRIEWREAQSYLCPAPWNSAQALAYSTFMVIKTHAYLGIHQVIFLEQSRWMGRLLRHYGHHSTTSLGAFVGCPWFIGRKYWMPI
jgi:hypothetical protein